MFLPSLVTASLLAASAAAEGLSSPEAASLARKLIGKFQDSYSIDWNNRPESKGTALNKIPAPNTTVYIQRHIEQSYVNAGPEGASFSLSKSTVIFKDITEGSSVTARSSKPGFQLSGPLQLSISRSTSESKQQYKNTGSQKVQTQKRDETCPAHHFCRFESWTYYVRINGQCGDEACEIRTPITGPDDDKPLTAIIFIPEELPDNLFQNGGEAAATAIRESFQDELARNYCIDWSKPPSRGRVEDRVGPGHSRWISRSPIRLLDKELNVTVYAKRSESPGQSSIGSMGGVMTVDHSEIKTESTTKGWSVNAESSKTFGFSGGLNTPIGHGSIGTTLLDISGAEDKTETKSDGTYHADGFVVSTKCPSGNYCHFETWAFYLHISGICRKLDDYGNSRPFQMPCELDMPLRNGANEPLTHFVGVFETMGQQKTAPVEEKERHVASADKNRVPKVIGREGDYCLLDTYEYYNRDNKKYLDWNTDDFVSRPGAPEPEHVERCDDPILKDAIPPAKKCYRGEIRAEDVASSPQGVAPTTSDNPPRQTDTPTEEDTSTKPETLTVVAKKENSWCKLDNGQSYSPDHDDLYDPVLKSVLPRPPHVQIQDPNHLCHNLKASSCPIPFQARTRTGPGITVKVIGSTPALGSWDVKKAVALDNAEYTPGNPLWKGTVSLEPGEVEYKFVKVRGEGESCEVSWLEGENLVYSVPEVCEVKAAVAKRGKAGFQKFESCG
ncbi:glucoamylase precursor [Ophiocordyceps camponoti-floridani]|uniref:Glucoamylase n=1 Tax=Ophiocordyceps camponoti-floridani TaxID=2030778 RepID=A0A8H4VDF0_9HYPO|nr:glucoamylase precursor [Ophiocordyceps camponoti-floridani]